MVTEFLARSLIGNLMDHMYDIALNSHRYLRGDFERESSIRFSSERKVEIAVYSLIMGLPFTAYIYFKFDVGYSIIPVLDPECSSSKDINLKAMLESGLSLKDDNSKVYEIVKAVYKLILKRPFDVQIISSMDAFLKLLALDSDFFLTDVIAYRRVYISLYLEQNPNIGD
jgi:hypothetical protein